MKGKKNSAKAFKPDSSPAALNGGKNIRYLKRPRQFILKLE